MIRGIPDGSSKVPDDRGGYLAIIQRGKDVADMEYITTTDPELSSRSLAESYKAPLAQKWKVENVKWRMNCSHHYSCFSEECKMKSGVCKEESVKSRGMVSHGASAIEGFGCISEMKIWRANSI
jgi:hypothetical protein